MIYANNITSTSLPLSLPVEAKRSSFMTYTQRKAREDQILLDSYIYYRQRKQKHFLHSKSSLAREERIRLYQQNFTQTIEADSGLKTWIQSSLEKGPILPPPKVQYPHIQKRETGFPSPKVSFSTFLKKAIKVSESPHKQPKKPQKKNKFFLPTSLNRFTKNTGQNFREHSTTEIKADKRHSANFLTSSEALLGSDSSVKREKVLSAPVAKCTETPHVFVSRPKKRHPSVFLEKLQQSSPERNSLIITHEGCSKNTLYNSCKLKQPSKSMTSSFRRTFQELVKDTDKQHHKSSTVGRKSVREDFRYSFTEKCKSTLSSDSLERKNKISFSFTSSLSTIRFMPQKSKRQSSRT